MIVNNYNGRASLEVEVQYYAPDEVERDFALAATLNEAIQETLMELSKVMHPFDLAEMRITGHNPFARKALLHAEYVVKGAPWEA